MSEDPQNPGETADLEKKPFSKGQVVIFLATIAVLLVIICAGLLNRRHDLSALEKHTVEVSVLSVNVITPTETNEGSLLVLPGNARAFNEASIYARANGYLKKWNADIGDHVKTGDVLAVIETPELDQELERARADLQTAEANEKLAELTANRWTNLLTDDAVSKQETDQYLSDFQAKRSALASAKANVLRLQKLQEFETILAPFDGIITARNTDIGSLIASGPGEGPKELFHLVSSSKLRVYVSVPEPDTQSITKGNEVDLTLEEYPGRVFKGKVSRDS